MPQSVYTQPTTTINQQNQPESTAFLPDQNQNQALAKTQDWFYGTEELLDALPKVWTRSMLYLLVSFAAIILPWAMLTKVDETGNAIGRIEPKGATQKLDSAVTGTIVSVNVKEGETVKAGQVLVKMESEVMETEIQQIKAKLEGLKNRKSQLEILKNQVLMAINIQRQQNQSQSLEKMAQVDQARQIFATKKSAYTFQNLEKLAQIDQMKQNIKSTQSNYRLVTSRLRRDVSEVVRYRLLLKEGIIPQTKLVELEKIAEESQRLQEEAKFNIQTARLRLKEQESSYQSLMNQFKSDIEQAKLRLQQEESSYKSAMQGGELALLKSQEQFKDLQNQITSLQSEIMQTEGQIISLNLQLKQRIIRSPIDGTIFELPIKKPGSVVQPGQMIAQIAPKNADLILKAHMASQHSGFVKVGMPVKIKFDAYPFQEYGILSGRITWISPNSKIQENSANRLETYEVDIALENPYIQVGNKQIPLTPGQTASAEAIIRQRRVIDFILDPFKKLQKNGLEL
ncbi:HlyD family efflux transporter periplasmic adaptor subunit [Dolichospermum circinale]|uniref:HlyD family efflux transporter periplasmic adaptor subunit n=1 Tax=Dolichospermum circinale CS-537/01 TaxID=3021739 RepID=A0ABT5A9M1_9CYAN|nr:HlyD family efflux transporter periplasmic adaptor subunit [Dolichospermum circinale]MDB9466368.1 HlyD family efflux transporter periplasmic adaptor subunit [Dolichospermum circinale CS-539/09]MDB9470060.1 HlyD family efflux transporter periplasmic adaptor subunit [Dolichospermum circinale CS-539]MDB9488662.1 HlyD family efflux transporter periplasmic adaptor subunit [Dolichospermum circinale CS-537/01]